MSIKIVPVSTDDNIDSVTVLAKEIWTHHYVPIIGEEQVEYMLSNFQSFAAIKSQISDGTEYFLVKIDNVQVGYIGLIVSENKDKILISKIYVNNAARGKGAGHAMLSFVEDKCIAEKIPLLWLTVNKMNCGAINWYKNREFVVTDNVKTDIGGGFFMDDYIMEKEI